MTTLPDVNVLVALLDRRHVFHDRAQNWFQGNAAHGWATFPITDNGAVRVLANPKYPGRRSLAEVAASVSSLRLSPGHIFWPDDISLLSSPLFHLERLASVAQITDAYLLALAVAHGGQLVTFDAKINISAVAGGATALYLLN